jgi:phosphatidylinositol glycan class B
MTKKNILVAAALVHFLAAIFGEGFHHFDEHFQIFEFLNLKWNGIQGAELAWEYREMIRPWFQVGVYAAIAAPFKSLGIDSPFFFAALFRLLSSFLGLFALYRLWPLIDQWVREERARLITKAVLHLAWFVPYIFSRTSSESFGISFFLLGISIFLDEKKRSFALHVLAGVFFGLSYNSRFQMALPVACLWFWGLISKRKALSELSATSLGVLAGLGIGAIFDRWGYGVWTFPLWDYYRTNFQEGIMARVQHYPWYWYFRWSLLRGLPPVSLPLILVTLWGWKKYWKHPLTWATLPLVLFHSLIGHKELRYVFPTIILAPIFLGMALEHFKDIENKRWVRVIRNLFLVTNLVALVIVSFKAVNPAPSFYRFMWNHPEIKEFYALDESPYTMLGLKIKFYKRPELKDHIVTSLDQVPGGGDAWFFFKNGERLMEFEKKPHCELLYSAYPRFVLNYNWGNWMQRSRVWSLFYCKGGME